MSLDYTIAEIKDTSTSAVDIYKQALQKARPQICEAYRNRPRWFSDEQLDTSALPVQREVGQLARNMMDGFCSDQPLPLPPSQEFMGGQCECQLYDVESVYNNPPQFVNSRNITVTSMPGQIIGIGTKIVNGVPTDHVIGSVCTGGKVTGTRWDAVRSKPANGSGSSTITRVIPKGFVDSCGNPSPNDPKPTTPPPPSFTFNPTVNTPRAPLVNVNVPVVVLPPIFIKPTVGLNFTFRIPINIGGLNFNFQGDRITYEGDDESNTNTLINNISLSKTEVNAAITQSTNTTATNINNSATAIRTNVRNDTTTLIANSNTAVNTNTNNSVNSAITNINSNTNTAVSNAVTAVNTNTDFEVNTLSTSLVAVNSNVSTGNTNLLSVVNSNTALVRADIEVVKLDVSLVGSSLVDIATDIEVIRRLEEECPCPPDPTSPDATPVKKPPEETTSENPTISLVTITLTRLPTKSLFGGGRGAPDKHIAGWFAWKTARGGYLPQMAINYQVSAFIKPLGAVGYAYTLTNNAQGFATEYVQPL